MVVELSRRLEDPNTADSALKEIASDLEGHQTLLYMDKDAKQ